VSPILVRPVREQFEHDRVIRVLQAKYKRKYEVTINPGAEQNAAVGVGDLAMYPDLVLFSQERVRKVQGTVEVETTESINTLEAMAEWGPFSRLRTPFFLYVPANSIDTVRRLCSEHSIDPAEIWTYHTALDQVRFTIVHRSPNAPKGTIAEHKPKPVAPVVVPTDDEVEEMSAVAPAAPARTGRSTAAPAGKAGATSPTGKAIPGKAVAGKAASSPTAAKGAAKTVTTAKPEPGEKRDKAGKNDKPSRTAKSKPAAAKTGSSKSAKSAKAARPAKAAKAVKAKGNKAVKKSKAARR
jgi:hypothetical protein